MSTSHSYMTIVIKIPADPAERTQVMDGFKIGENVEGGIITALSLDDEITRIEYLEEHVEQDILEAAGKYTIEMHRLAEAS